MKKETYYQLLNQRPGWKLLVHCNCFDTVVGGYLCWHYIQTQKTQHSGNFQCTSLWGEYASPCKAWKMLTSVYNYSWTVSLGNCTLNKERNIHDGVLSCVCLFLYGFIYWTNQLFIFCKPNFMFEDFYLVFSLY